MKYSTTLLLLLYVIIVNGQPVFNKVIRITGSSLQEARRIIRTPDNNFLVVGYAAANGTSLDREALVFKMNGSGTILWAKKIGGSNWEEFYDVVQVGNFYYCLGYTRTYVNGTFLSGGNNLNADIFLVKINLNGTVVWAKNMGKPANGSSATDGNDIGFRLVPSGQGGVMISARINSGANTNQNNGIIWVDNNGKARWAYQYDLSSHGSNNELTFSIWRDGPESYVTGGWISTFGPPSFAGGMLFKVNQNGELVWDKNTRCSASGVQGVFESMYFGYYNHNTRKIYSTDYYAHVSGSVREAQVCTNLSSNGNAPSTGGIPQAKRFHYGTADSSSNTLRSLIFPIGDGYQQFILGAYDVTTPVFNTTKHVTLIAIDKDLNYQWSKQVGVHHVPNLDGILNQVFDMVTCDSENHSLMAVGTVARSNGNKDILISRFGGTGTLETCEATAAISSSVLTETTTSINLTRINLNTTNCGNNCWADDDLIGSVNVTNVTLIAEVASGPCTGDKPGEGAVVAEKFEDLNFITPSEISSAANGLNKLSFEFQKQPKEVYFELTNITGDFVFERFFGNMTKLTSGFDFTSMALPKGEYVWEIEAVYEDELGIERKTNQFTLE